MTRARDSKTTAGEWLANARKEAGLSQGELAGLVGTTKSSIGNYEQGRAMVPDKLAGRIALALRRDLAETRAGLGLWAGPGEEAAPPSVIEAILADPDLIPEAKQHLQSQYALLLRLTQPPTNRAEVEAAARADLHRARILRQPGSQTVTETSSSDPGVLSDPSSTVTTRKCDATD